MKCVNCGNEFDGKFCPECGAPSDGSPYGMDAKQKVLVAQEQPKQKHSVCLLISWILGALYCVYAVATMTGTVSAQTDAAIALGASIGFAIVAPHLIVTFLAAVFTMLAWAMNKRGFALTGGILFAVAMALFPLYFMFVIVQLILAFVGFARLKQINT